jgi:hypothetical protein
MALSRETEREREREREREEYVLIPSNNMAVVLQRHKNSPNLF